jgi:hypothetical protein
VGIQAVYANLESGTTMQLALFIGPDASDASVVRLVDLTPGISRRSYDGASTDEAIDDFKSGNAYPRGKIKLVIPTNKASVRAQTREIETTGSSLWSTWSGRAGWAALGLGALALLLTATGVGTAFVPALIVAGSGAGLVSGGLSLYDRIQQAKVDPAGVAIDLLGMASSIIGGAAAFRALRMGTAVALASRTGRYLFWAEFVTNSVSGVLIAVESVDAINAILDRSDMTREQKVDAIVRLLGTIALQAGMFALSVRELGAVKTRFNGVLDPELVKKLPTQSLLVLNLLDDDALRTVSALSHEELLKVVDMVRKDPETIASLLRTAPYRSAAEIETALKDLNKRITTPTSIFENIDTSAAPPGWKFEDSVVSASGKTKPLAPGADLAADPGKKMLKTDVTYTATDGSKKVGWFIREYDPATNTLYMKEAYLQDLPNMVKTDKPMIAGKGTPTVTYVSLYQMKKMGVAYAGASTFVMAQIENVETILHLAWLRRKYPSVSPDELIRYTASPKYAETTIIQSGRKVTGAKLKGGAPEKIGALMHSEELDMGAPGSAGHEALKKKHEGLLAAYGFTRDDELFMKFYIELQTVPFSP